MIDGAFQEPTSPLTLMVCEWVIPGTPDCGLTLLSPTFVFNNDDTPHIDKDILIALSSITVPAPVLVLIAQSIQTGCRIHADRKLTGTGKQSCDYSSPQLQSSLI